MIIHDAAVTGSLTLNGVNLNSLSNNNFATTGSNSFVGNQTITGSISVTDSITAQKLVVQTVSSSVVYSSGSNIFGNSLSNTQTITGSVGITGSLSVNGVSTVGSVIGTTSYIPKFTNANTIGNSVIYDDGAIGINNTTPSSYYNSQLVVGNDSAGFGSITMATTSTGLNSIFFSRSSSGAGRYRGSISYVQSSDNINFRNSGDLLRMTLDGSGNLGLGVTPSAWNVGRVLQINTSGAFVYGSNNNTIYGLNAFFESGWKYTNNAAASYYEQFAGAHQWFTAPSGTAGNAISFTQAMTLFANGNLGLGQTTDAGYKLDVNGTGRFSGDLILNQATQPLINFQTGGISRANISATSESLILNSITGNDIRLQNNGTTNLLIASTGAATFSSSVTAGSFSINSNGTISSNGFWGTLHTKGAGSYSDWSLINSGGSGIMWNPTGTLNMSFGGNVGIGTTSPTPFLNSSARTLDISSTTNPSELALTGQNSNLYLGNGALASYIYSTGAYPLIVGTNGSERMRITSGGNVLIGTTTDAGYKLDVNGTGRFSGNVLIGNVNRLRLTVSGTDSNSPTLGTASGTMLLSNSAGSNEYGTMFGISSSGYGWIQQQRVDGTATAYNLSLQPSGGNVLIGTTTDNGAKLQVNGGIRTSNPSGGTSAEFKIGQLDFGSPGAANSYIKMDIGGFSVKILVVS